MNSWKKVYKRLILVQSNIQRNVFKGECSKIFKRRIYVEQLQMISIVPAHNRAISVINRRALSMYSTNIKERGEKENGMG